MSAPPGSPPPVHGPVVVVKAYDLVLWLVQKVEKFPKSNRFSVGQRLLEQQPAEPAGVEPQQQPADEPQQQCWLPLRPGGGPVGVTPPVARAAAILVAAGVRSPRPGPDPGHGAAVTEDPPGPGPRPTPSATAGAPPRLLHGPDPPGRHHGQRRPHRPAGGPHLHGDPAGPGSGTDSGCAEVVNGSS